MVLRAVAARGASAAVRSRSRFVNISDLPPAGAIFPCWTVELSVSEENL